MPKTPPEPSRWVTTKEAYHLLGVSRARFDEWRTAGLISPDWHNGNRPMYLRADLVTLPYRLPRGSKSVGPLLPREDQARAIERANAPPVDLQQPASQREIASLHAECLGLLAPNGEEEGRLRAFERTVRIVSQDRNCSLDEAKRLVLDAIAKAKEPV
jgi:hypothetical protein